MYIAEQVAYCQNTLSSKTPTTKINISPSVITQFKNIVNTCSNSAVSALVSFGTNVLQLVYSGRLLVENTVYPITEKYIHVILPGVFFSL